MRVFMIGQTICHRLRRSQGRRRAGQAVFVFGTTIVLFMFALLAAPPAEAACVKGPVTCGNSMGMRTCSATLMCTNPPGAGFTRWILNNPGTMDVNVTFCGDGTGDVFSPTATFSLTGMALQTAPTNRTCDFDIYTAPNFAYFGAVTITTAEGLPVELMDFSVESGDDSSDSASGDAEGASSEKADR